MENRNTGSDAGDVSSATAVLLGALAPGVNVRIFTLRSLPILTFSIPFFSLNFCDYFFVLCDGLDQRLELSRWVWLCWVLFGLTCNRVIGQLRVCVQFWGLRKSFCSWVYLIVVSEFFWFVFLFSVCLIDGGWEWLWVCECGDGSDLENVVGSLML